ncbi:uncharacterized protein MELLADRAFT_108045 [Melampsora larici-populina 98AG31]|uniref:Uncharacterized protein n=1 Tax=Melampsora larici-populina (strain 98AG31 / pathotype 3-4-7) TaxID=747676 RepID=F4RRS6_MELLP|nr:uncharacterized protein MELLADRAFT_108045 [Melampsora larici-populina 98AG31]EGG04903.1 hypothetical protein MELLADRAFT_108045 [Melampsora larici-populina 98AG31]
MMVNHAVDHLDSSRPQPMIVSTPYHFQPQTMNSVPQYQPVIGVPYGFQPSPESLGYLPPNLKTNYKIPGPQPQYPDDPSRFVRHGYVHHPIQPNRQPADPRFQALLNQGQVNEFHLRKQWLNGIVQKRQKVTQNAKQKVIKSTRKGKKPSPLGVKKVNKNVSNKNKGKVLTNGRPNQAYYPLIRSPKDIHEGISAGMKSTITEVSNTVNNRAVANLLQLNARKVMLERGPKTLQDQVMLERVKGVICQILQKHLNLPHGLIPENLEPTLANVLQWKEGLMKAQVAHTNEYRQLDSLLDQAKKTPLLVEIPTSGATESVGSTISGDDLKTSEEVDSELTKLSLGPSSNYEVASKRFQRIPTFDLNKEPVA